MLSTILLALSSLLYFLFLLLVSSWTDLPTEQTLTIMFLPIIFGWLKYAAGKLEDIGRKD